MYTTALTGTERILNSALSLYSKYGIKSITMDDLCRELGISKKTLYRHVTDKQDLIRKVIDYEIELQRKSMEKMFRSEMNAIDELMHVNKQIHLSQSIHSPTFYFDLKKYYPAIYNEWVEYKRKKLYEMIMRNLEKGVAEGLFRQDMDARVISKLHVARVEMLHASGIVDEEELSAGRFIDEIFKYHIHGICNDKGLKYFRQQLDQSEKQTEQ
ncbi:MAG: TetR/AcrR family transcriptional regulator [Bacteroidales bacterium]|nr:TetR/AcrR family transcriptional regulator [Bacteroidales bacterium]MDT8432156.1 TetR/AcrR family transcriptional regulator [Bacteroidales bacterium]